MAQQELHTRRSKLKEQYKEAKNLVEIGNLFKSAEILSEILDRDESFDEAIMLLHEIHLKRDEPQRANAIIAKYSSELEVGFLNRMLLLQANYNYQLGEYEAAHLLLKNVKSDVFEVDSLSVDFLRESVQFSLEQTNNPLDIDFQKLEYPLNDFEQQYFPSITANGQLVFTMRNRFGRGDENIFVTNQINNSSDWSEPLSISPQINTERNEGTASISADGRTLVFTSCNRPDNIGSCDLYVSYLINNEWSSPELLGEEVNSKEWDSQPSLTANGESLYFVSMREGGFGKQDIWVSEKVNGQWTEALNLGPRINTSEDDCSPFIYLDEQTLIFATKGRIGLGGYDLFKTTKMESEWTEAINLGYPINNAFDQIGYCISVDQWAYFSSSDPSGRIFLQKFKVPETLVPTVDYSPNYYGKVLNEISGETISAQIQFIFENNDTIRKRVEEDGQLILERKDFKTVMAEKRGFKTRRLNRIEFLKDSTLRLMPFEEGEQLNKCPILFEFDSDIIQSSNYSELDRIASLIKKHPELLVEIQGHTDKSGPFTYNLELSKKRAKAVYRYISEQLESSDGISYVGYGETMPLEDPAHANNTPANRRVDIVLRTIVR